MAEWSSAVMIWVSGLIFAVSHTVPASLRCKQWCYVHGLREPRYRLLYSIFAMIATAAWALFVHALPDAPLYHCEGLLWWLLVIVQLIGVALFLAALQPIDGLAFLGLRKSRADIDPFIERGIYRWLRHPMYAGAMLILLAMPVQSWNGFHFALVISLYFIIGARFEEARMVAMHPAYRDYQQRVPAFVPSGSRIRAR